MASDKKHIAQSAVLPYRTKGKDLEFLLITSHGSGRWVLPKGHLEPQMTPKESAVKEAFEEAGVNGKVSQDALGHYTYTKDAEPGGLSYRVEVFAMHVNYTLDSWPEVDSRTRQWMTPKRAAASVDEKALRKLLLGFADSFKK